MFHVKQKPSVCVCVCRVVCNYFSPSLAANDTIISSIPFSIPFNPHM
jgi:hypothetical protein